MAQLSQGTCCRLRSAWRSCSSSSRLEPRPPAGVKQSLEPEVERPPDHGVGRRRAAARRGGSPFKNCTVLVVIDVREMRGDAHRREHQERHGHAREPAVARPPRRERQRRPRRRQRGDAGRHQDVHRQPVEEREHDERGAQVGAEDRHGAKGSGTCERPW